VDRFVTSEDLEALRLALTRLYINKGYINSGAILPDQTVSEGVITFHIIEGTLTDVTLEGQRWFREGYLRRRLTLNVVPPLNIGTLQERLQLLQQDDRIERLQAELSPGVRLGESALLVRVEERLPFLVALEFNNYLSPSIGAEQGLITVAHQNLTGHGDILSFTYGRSAGLNPEIDTSYSLPLNARDTTVSFRYRRNNSSVIEEPFTPLDISSNSESFTLALRQPLWRTLSQELALAFSAEHLWSRTLVFASEPSAAFAPAPGPTNAVDTALRLALEWLDRTPSQVLAVRSRFSLGINVLGATITDQADTPDGQFFAWLGQFQYGRRLGVQDIQLLFRLDAQLTNAPLLPLEQIVIGGRFSVRGYRENQLVRDNGLIVSLESRIPLVRNTPWAEYVQVVPFVDFGQGWNSKVPTPGPKTLLSIGLGLRWGTAWRVGVPLRTQAEVFWGYKLKDVRTEGGNLQDKGLSLQFVVAAF
jgi:hemolysin activation/secretion protein